MIEKCLNRELLVGTPFDPVRLRASANAIDNAHAFSSRRTGLLHLDATLLSDL